MLVNPTLACADRLHLARELDTLARLGVPLLHIDIMDGHYVPNLCFDFDTVKAIAQYTDIPLDIHLMAESPDRWLDTLASFGPKYLSFHPDATVSPFRVMEHIRERGCEPGIVLNPGITADAVEPLLPLAGLVQVMGVEPGFAGQPFRPHTRKTVERLATLRQSSGLHYSIGVDGGVNAAVARCCRDAGADIVVAGALAIFGQGCPLDEAYGIFAGEVGL